MSSAATESLRPADHRGLRIDHAPDRVEGAFGAAFLHIADQGVDQDHGEDHHRVHRVTDRKRKHGSDDQHVDQDIVKLEEEANDLASLGRRGKLVRPEAFLALDGFLRR